MSGSDTSSPAQIWRLPKAAFLSDGGVELAQEEMLVDNVSSTNLAVDVSGVYWSASDTVLRLARTP